MYTTCRFTKEKLLKPPIKIAGGKIKTRDIIYQALSSINCISYVEPFIGSLSVLMGKQKHEYEWVNDCNPDIINFYRSIETNPDKLWIEIQESLANLRKYQKEFFISYRDNPPKDLIKRGAWLYIINKSSMNGIVRYRLDGKCNSSYCQTVEGRGWITEEWYELVKHRIKNVKFFNKDFSRFLLYPPNTSDTIIFLDPPYFLRGKDDPNGTVTIYNGKKFTTEDHEDLRQFLWFTKAKWVMTINDCDWVRESYRGFNIIDNYIFYSISQTVAGRGLKKELIISNFDLSIPDKLLKDYNLNREQTKKSKVKAL